MAKLLTEQQHDYLISIQKGRFSYEVAELMNKKFNLNLTQRQIKTYRRNHRLNSGLNGYFNKGHKPYNKGKKYPGRVNSGSFKKGVKPPNYVEIGTIRYTGDGYPRRKIKDPNVWEYCHRAEWEKHRGKIPDGYAVSFLDGDKTNWDISNLALLSKNELARMNQNDLFSSNPELTKAGIGIVKINGRIKELTNDNNNKQT
ncbi:TPA: HNH endonuclease [Streptococcus agalactiae]|uniref:HNH endonuclease signature motif containing protein n=1 Tax=Streptococcus agalactiae TaxID=1311 RepID=UPI0022EA607E|nr:HNH endonuclease signature motif containing protein [Streptococcus agalactiae]HEM9585166.1 HNH endonuclease [Streptococcus agalactiae]HEM9598527.1 HNH endonuclease [Streptococcus agalactiae]HEM9635420.1 HNH endonuclease [Streptococcus agalactiae]HEM9644540.1 HNH endonuclease [Streptococcus agalactiae]HEM9648590.1 HNH endonuclease [Streptococcus agalactiae]